MVKREIITLEELNRRWQRLHPGGRIWDEQGKHCVTYYAASGKIYRYAVDNHWQLAKKLDLLNQEDIDRKQGIKRMDCCNSPVPADWDGYRCPGCGKQLRQQTVAELETEALWS